MKYAVAQSSIGGLMLVGGGAESRLLALLVITVLVGTVLSSPAGADTIDITEATDEWIVTLESGINPRTASQGLVQSSGGELGFIYDSVLGGFSFHGSPRAAEALGRSPLVRNVTRSTTLKLVDVAGFGIFRIDADDAHNPVNGNHRGGGTRIAVIDSGVDLDHPDLLPNLDVANGYNCITPGADPDDDNGHGTHVAGIAAAAYGPNGFGVAGVAAEATIVPIKAFDAQGEATTGQVLCGINHVAALA
ncbi:MAG: S8 family serine peptidase, partial [Acidimicrobiia bacterium]